MKIFDIKIRGVAGCPRRGGSVVLARAMPRRDRVIRFALRGYVRWRIRRARSAMCGSAYAERFSFGFAADRRVGGDFPHPKTKSKVPYVARFFIGRLRLVMVNSKKSDHNRRCCGKGVVADMTLEEGAGSVKKKVKRRWT